MGGGSGKDGRGANGGKPRSSNSRSEKAKSKNAPPPSEIGSVITTTAGPITISGFVQHQAGQKPYEFVYNRYGGFSAGKYASTYDHGMAQRNPLPPVKTSSGSSAGGASLVGSQAHRVSATPPTTSAAEFKAPSSTAKSAGKSSKSSSKHTSTSIARPAGLDDDDDDDDEAPLAASKKSAHVKSEPFEAFRETAEAVVQSIAHDGQFQSGDVKREVHSSGDSQKSRKRTTRRKQPTSTGASKVISLTDYEAASEQPAQIHRPVPHHHQAVGGLLPAFDTLATAPSYFSPAPFSFVAAQGDIAGGSQRHLYASHDQPQLSQELPETLHSLVFDASFGHVGTSASPVSFSGSGGGDSNSILAQMYARQQQQEREAAELKQQILQFMQQQQRAQQHQAADPEPDMANPSPPDGFVAELIQRSPHCLDDIRNADSDDPILLDYIKEIAQGGSGGSDPSMVEAVSAIESDLKAEVDTTRSGNDEPNLVGGGVPGTVFRAIPGFGLYAMHALDLAHPVKSVKRQWVHACLDLAREPKPEPKHKLPSRRKVLPDLLEHLVKPRHEARFIRLTERSKTPYRSPLTVTALTTIAQFHKTTVTGLLISDPSLAGEVMRRRIRKELKKGDPQPEKVNANIAKIMKAAKQDGEGKKKRAPKRKRTSDDQPAIDPKQIKQELVDDEYGEPIPASEALKILRARHGARPGARKALAFMKFTHPHSQMERLHTLETALKFEIKRFDPGFVLKGDAVSSPAGPDHDEDDEDHSRDPTYTPSSSKRRKQSADTASIADSSVAADDESESAGPSRRKAGDFNAQKHILFEKNKFADDEYSDEEFSYDPLPKTWTAGTPPSGGEFPVLKLTANINYSTMQQHDLIGHTAEETTKIHDRIRSDVEPQLAALQFREYHQSDPRHNANNTRKFAGIIRKPSTWVLGAEVPTGVYLPPMPDVVVKHAKDRAKEFGGFKFSFQQTEARHFKGLPKAHKLNVVTICPATDLKPMPGMPSFYRLEPSSGNKDNKEQIWTEVGCTKDVITKCFKSSPGDLREMTLAINGNITLQREQGETEDQAKERGVKIINRLLKKTAEKLPTIKLSKGMLKLVWQEDAPLPLVQAELWPWLHERSKAGQIFARYEDLPFDPTSDENVGMCFDTTNRHSLLSFALGRGCKFSLPHSNIAMSAGVVIKRGRNQALIPSHHYCVKGRFLDILIKDGEKVLQVMKDEWYPEEYKTCATSRWEAHNLFLFNPELLTNKGIEFVMSIRKTGEFLHVLEGGFAFVISFGRAESFSVDWLSAPTSWLATHKPLVSSLVCNDRDYGYIDQRKEWFEGAYNALIGVQDPRARVMRNAIDACYGCLDEAKPGNNSYNWRKNHTATHKSADKTRDCCVNPFGHYTITKREELREVNLLRGNLPFMLEPNAGEDEGTKCSVCGRPVENEEGSDNEVSDQDVTDKPIKQEPTDQESDSKPEATPQPIVKEEKKTPAKKSPKAKGQKTMPEKEEPAKAEQSADVVHDAGEPESSGEAPIRPPRTKKLTKAQLQQQEEEKARKEEEEEDRNKPLHHSVDPALSDVATGNGEQDDTAPLEIVTEPVVGGDPKPTGTDEPMDTQDGSSDPSKGKSGGDLQPKNAEAVTEPAVGDLQPSDPSKYASTDPLESSNGGELQVNGGEKMVENEGEKSPIVDIEGENDSGGDGDGSADENGSGYDTDAPSTDDGRSMVGDPPVHRVEVGVGKRSDANNDEEDDEEDDEELEEVEADDEEEETDEEADEDEPMEED